MSNIAETSWGKRRLATRESIMALLLRGQLPAGERIKELALAQQLGVSRTPVREALIVLEEEGFFLRDRRGLMVQPLTVQEAMQVYSILGSLEAAALRQSGIAVQATVDELKAVCRQMRATPKGPEQLLGLHSRFHSTLLGYCPNLQLVAMIQLLDKKALRYEYAYMRSVGERANTVEPGEGIVLCVERRDVERAANLMQLSRLARVDPIVRWLQRPGTRRGRSYVPGHEVKQGAA